MITFIFWRCWWWKKDKENVLEVEKHWSDLSETKQLFIYSVVVTLQGLTAFCESLSVPKKKRRLTWEEDIWSYWLFPKLQINEGRTCQGPIQVVRCQGPHPGLTALLPRFKLLTRYHHYFRDHRYKCFARKTHIKTRQCHLSSVIIPDKALAINVELIILEMYLQESFHFGGL